MTLALFFALAVATRVAAVLAIPWAPAFDDAWYFQKAVGLASGAGYHHRGSPTAYFPVGYPMTLAPFLWLFGPKLIVGQCVNIVLSIATVATIYLFGRALMLSRGSSLLGAGLFAFLPNQVLSCCLTMSEITFSFALLLGSYLLVIDTQKPSRLLPYAAGLVFGWATLVRPQGIAVPFIVLVVVALSRARGQGIARRRLARAAFVALGLATVVLPWTARNYAVFDDFVLVSTNGGDNLLIGNHAKSTQKHALPELYYPSDVDITTLSEPERSHLGAQLARQYVTAHPLEALVRTPRKIWFMYRSDLGVTNLLWEYNHKRGTVAYYAAQSFTQLLYLLVLIAGLVFLGSAWRGQNTSMEARLLVGIPAAIIGYFTLVTMVFFGDARYHQPVMPFLCLAAGAGLTKFARARTLVRPAASLHSRGP